MIAKFNSKTHLQNTFFVFFGRFARKIEFLTFITVCKSFRPTALLGEFFCIFSNWFELSIKFWVSWCPCRIFAQQILLLLNAYISFFANFKAKRGRNGWKKEKNLYFINVSWNPILHPFPACEAPLLSKKSQNRCVTLQLKWRIHQRVEMPENHAETW